MLRTTTIVALASFATAQLASQCLNALAGIVSNQEASACLSPGTLFPLITAGNNTSIAGPISAWVTNVCAAAPCSNATIAAIVTNITSGCQTQFPGLTGGPSGDPSATANSLIPLVQQFYPTVRRVLCLRNGNTNCVNETLTNIERVTGPLTIGNLFNRPLASNSSILNIPDNVTCTDCIKAAYNVISTDIPSIVQDARPALQSTCGASFVDGNTPSGISQAAADTSNNTNINNSSNNGATTLIVSGVGVSTLAIVSAVFVLL